MTIYKYDMDYIILENISSISIQPYKLDSSYCTLEINGSPVGKVWKWNDNNVIKNEIAYIINKIKNLK